jgi:carbon storage regulator CsrA
MLVLSRKSLQAVVVGGPHSLEPLIKVTVLEIKGGSVRLGFEGAAEVPIHRLEVWERIRNGERPESTMGGPPAPIA